MTEQEWLTTTEPLRMLDFLRDRAGPRKLRLFACACCRRLLHPLMDERCRQAVEIAERAADATATARQLQRAGAAVSGLRWEASKQQQPATKGAAAAAHFCVLDWSDGRAHGNAVHVSMLARDAEDSYHGSWGRYLNANDPDYSPSHPAQAKLLREVFGNPFRPVAAEASWLTPGVVGLARAIYDGRLFADLPVLADALEEAGSAERELLAHCRAAASHTLGCWALDTVLGKHDEPPDPPRAPAAGDEAPPF